MSALKKYVIASLVAHLIILLISSIISSQHERLKRTLVVFGAHSRKASSVQYKGKKIVPFSTSRGGKSGTSSITGKQNQQQKAPSHKSRITKKNKRPAEKKTVKKSTPQNIRHKKAVPQQKKPKKAPPKSDRQIAEPSALQEPGKTVKVASSSKTNKREVQKNTRSMPEEKVPEKTITKKTPEKVPVAHDDKDDDNLPDDQQPTDDIAPETMPEAAMNQDFNLIGSYKSEELLVYHKHVQTEVDRLWRPPVGVPRGTVCTIEFTVDTNGAVTAKPIDRSIVLIYYLSIITIAHNFQFHRSLWGKTFKISFRQ